MSLLRVIVTLAGTLALMPPPATSAPAPRTNPLLVAWSGPYGGLPPFDRIRVADFAPALEAGMAAQRREIAAITANRAPPTFDNTVLALERSGRLLRQVQMAYGVWTGSLGSPAVQALERRIEPRLAAFRDELVQNPRLFQRVDAVYRSAEMQRLNAEQQRLVWSHHTEMVKQGAMLDAPAKARVRRINQRLATLYTAFSQNLLADEDSQGLVIKEPADLAGLSPADVEAAAQEARRRGLAGRWVIANTRSAMEPFLARSPRRALREQAWHLWTYRGDNGNAHDNNRIVGEILALRGERSKLMGFANFAQWNLSDTMARQPQAALDLMLQVWRPAVTQVRYQLARMQKLADDEARGAGDVGFTIQPWDFRYYAEKLRQAEYDFDAEELTPYLQLDKVREAMFWAAGRLYGLRFEPLRGVPVFHRDVTVYRVLGREGELVGLWYFDPYAREGKKSGAWMDSYRAQNRLFGADVRPIVSNNANFKRAAPGEPVLITWDDAVTMFHEFGHALHGLCSDVRYPSLAGPASLLDFGEFPSQVNEYWLSTPPVLAMLVNRAGQPLPPALLQKLERSRNFDKPFWELEFLASALLDMKLHLQPGDAPIDPRSFEKATLDELGMPPAVVARHRIPQFAHVFASEGYAAGYYGYLWAEVLSRDAFDAFTETGDAFDAATAERYRKTVLSVGNSVDPAEAFRDFRGRDPQVEALLRANGFAPDAQAAKR
ncbi:M3 family metallopeptidase [Ideonella sp.]|uniref:M3 family metallopeptidase n=1 Tax=Ideonella sp. TaxID=1929293 RepID=UPI002B475A36|nr:M3 family metallopeptidase [Ideonella sp.]HJV69308.1 M3 family metallopeptidase [Ideonella sp.]